MCGLTGIISYSKNFKKQDVEEMLKTILHRGPNQKIIKNSEFSSVGFVRLSILDLTEYSNQPLTDFNNNIEVFFNGEIYNYQELKKKFFPNINFKSSGDGEIIVHLYKKIGIKFVNYIKGMFAIYLFDKKKNVYYLIRDRFGIKPLYYYLNKKNKDVIFGSEIQALHAHKKIKKEVNFEQIYYYLNYSQVNSNNGTCYKDINQVPAGSYLEIQKDSVKLNYYYKIEDYIDEDKDKDLSRSFKYYLSDIKKKFDQSFNQHSRFDVKGGIHLSSGSDSSILALLAKKNNKNLKCFTFGYKEKQFSEAEDAKIIAEQSGLSHDVSFLESKEVPDLLSKVLKVEYEPFSSMRILSQHKLFREYKNDAKVIFDGSGGDEIGAGYNYHIIPWYFDCINSKRKANFDRRLKNVILKAKNSFLKTEDFILGSIKNILNPGSTTVDGSTFDKKGLISKDFLQNYSNSNLNFKRPFKSYLRNAQYLDLMHYKLPRCLKYIDRASMSNSVESRVPFLDHELVESCFQVPSDLKIIQNQQRIITKYPFRNIIDKKYLFKNKKSIADPQSFWIFRDLYDFTMDIFSSSNFLSKEIINNKNIIKQLEYLKKKDGHVNSFLIFQLLSLEIWLKEVVK